MPPPVNAGSCQHARKRKHRETLLDLLPGQNYKEVRKHSCTCTASTSKAPGLAVTSLHNALLRPCRRRQYANGLTQVTYVKSLTSEANKVHDNVHRFMGFTQNEAKEQHRPLRHAIHVAQDSSSSVALRIFDELFNRRRAATRRENGGYPVQSLAVL